MVASIPLYDYGDSLPVIAGASITGARFLNVNATMASDNTIQVKHAGAGEYALGVSAVDAASGAVVTMHHSTAIITPVTAGTGGLTAGAAVKSDANGQAIAQGGTGVILGYALNTCNAGDLAFIKRV